MSRECKRLIARLTLLKCLNAPDAAALLASHQLSPILTG
jgi:hypothetical protein